MNPLVELNLTLILFLPWFLILVTLFSLFPRTPRGWRRRLYDVVSVALAVAAFLWSVYWSYHHADPSAGRIWRQVLPTAVGYGVFLGVMVVAFFARGPLLRPRDR